MAATAETLAGLAARIARIEAGDPGGREPVGRLRLGPDEIDGALGGGLKRGALHAVTAANATGAAAATGFAAALAGRAAEAASERGRAVLWIRQDMAARENGELWAPGLSALGLDPDRLVLLCARGLTGALKAAEAGLGCRALAAVVIEPFGAMTGFDRIAGRRLSLAAGRSGGLALVLRIVPPPGLPEGLLAADTRWLVAPLSSSWAAADAAVRETWDEPGWGRPLARAELVRNRLGSLGRWPLAWGFDDGAFRLAERVLAGVPAAPSRPDAGAGVAADPRARAAEPADRQGATAREGDGPVRRAG